MQKSTTRIRTSHVGRLPPPKGWEDMPARLANGEVIDSGEIASHVVPAIAETVKKQVEIGIDCINDGEFWTARSLAHYAAHFTGLEARPVKLGEPPTTRHSTRERDEFCDFYADMDKLGTLFFVPGEKPMPPMTERHGPHTHDLPLEHIVDLVLAVKAQTYSFEAGNVRHEHEWRAWQAVKVPPGKILMPGVVSHATNLVEHPQLVADRILRYTAILGRENVIAGTDCGLGGRVHSELAWAKLRALVEGAQLASKNLWRR